MAINLPGLNYSSKLNIDDLTFNDQQNEKAILDRTTVVFGQGSLTTPRFGIIDAINPRDLVSEETNRPLLVYQSIIDPLRVNITAGVVVTANGAIVSSPTLLEDVALTRVTANDINVVYMENSIIDADPTRLTRYNVLQKVRRIQDTNVIRIDLLNSFQNAVLYPPNRKANIVVLAVVTVVETSGGLELHFDYTNGSYEFNRPWYSPVDIEHRSKLGGGLVTDTNIHGLTFNDLASGNLTLYDQLLPYGMIQARDDDVKGVVGTICYEVIEPTRILVDGTGLTSASRYGGIGASYIMLANYPVQITAFYQQSHKGRAIAFDHITGSKLVVLPSPEAFTSTAVIHYNQVFALAPPAQILSNVLGFGQPSSTKELILTGGIALSQVANQFIDFDGSGPVPRNYTLYVTAQGTILRTPQTVQTPLLLDDIGLSLYPLSASIFGPAKISIGLAGATPATSMAITIRLFGKDVDGNSILEDIVFSGSTWVSVSVPGVETPDQYILSSNIFRIITDIQVMSRANDGPNSKIQIWAELETSTTLALNKLAKVAHVVWDGVAIADIKDRRQIAQSLPVPISRYAAMAEVTGLGGTAPSLVYSEDFTMPKLRDTTDGYQIAVAAAFSIIVNDYSRIQAGDQVSFPTGKIITAIVSGLPNRAIGQYLAASSNQDTRNDIILTVLDVTFDSGFAAVADTSTSNTVICTSTTLGARGNGPVSEPIEGDPSALLISGDSVGGIDAFGECFMAKHQDFIDTPIPSPSIYDVTSYRYRFLSVPLAIDSVLAVKVLVYGIPAPQTNVQLRVRVAIGSSAVWQPWEVITGNGAEFTITKSSAITKMQVELFGRASGFSVYEV